MLRHRVSVIRCTQSSRQGSVEERSVDVLRTGGFQIESELTRQETTSLDQAGTNKPEVQQGVGTIEIQLRPGKWTARSPGPPTCLDVLGTMKESESK